MVVERSKVISVATDIAIGAGGAVIKVLYEWINNPTSYSARVWFASVMIGGFIGRAVGSVIDPEAKRHNALVAFCGIISYNIVEIIIKVGTERIREFVRKWKPKGL